MLDVQGDWRGISRQYVHSRSPTQVASHAQKYFIRQSVGGKRKRRTSLFDLVPDKQQVYCFKPKFEVSVRAKIRLLALILHFDFRPL